jgi:hypothetical protein
MMDGWAINRACTVGNGSSGTIADCHYNGSYWYLNRDSASCDNDAWDPAIRAYVYPNKVTYLLGDCTEQIVKVFDLAVGTFIKTTSQNGRGPNVDAISPMCDSTIHGYVFDSAASSTINIVNPCFTVVLAGYTGNNGSGVAVTSTTNFFGKARFFNSPLWGGCEWDYIINGGDVGFELVHMQSHSEFGSQVNGGVLHMVNVSAYITDNPNDYFPIYNVSFSTNAGTAGKISEIIGCFTGSGWSYTNPNTNNPVNVWQDYALFGYRELQNAAGVSSTPPAPDMSIKSANANSGIILQWPYSDSTYDAATSLCFSTNLNPPVAWTQISIAPVYSNNQWTVTLPFTTNQCGFYYLPPQH